MEATVDEVGRIVVPKLLRDRLRLTPGSKVDVSEYGDGLHIARGAPSGEPTYDGLVALAARSAGLPLASRDRRAPNTYLLLAVPVEVLG